MSFRIFPVKFDWLLFVFLLILLGLGLTAIYTASAYKIGDEIVFKNFYIKQIFWIIISLLALLIIVNTPKHIIDIFIYPLYGISILFLIIVLFAPAINGSHRWIILGPLRFQPSELAKLLTILAVAKSISKPYMSEFKILRNSIGLIALPAFLVLIEPDLGTSLTFVIVFFILITFSELPFFYSIILISPVVSIVSSVYYPAFILFMMIFILIMFRNKLSMLITLSLSILNTFIFFITPIFWNFLKDYQKSRILTFVDPSRDPYGAGYQIIQSKIAVGSGGLSGKGFLLGTQKNLNFVPEHHTDFIFSVIGEELGFFGCAILIGIFFMFFSMILRNVSKMKSLEMKLSIIGILGYLLFQMFINIGMNIGIAPTTGIPLPFISYGGSNLLINMIGIAIILNYKAS